MKRARAKREIKKNEKCWLLIKQKKNKIKYKKNKWKASNNTHDQKIKLKQNIKNKKKRLNNCETLPRKLELYSLYWETHTCIYEMVFSVESNIVT